MWELENIFIKGTSRVRGTFFWSIYKVFVKNEQGLDVECMEILTIQTWGPEYLFSAS